MSQEQAAYQDVPTLDPRWSTAAPVIILSTSAVINGGETLKRGAPLITYDGGATYSKLDPIAAFDASAAYAAGALVVYKGGVYKALSAVTAGAFDASEWALDGFYRADGVLLTEEAADGEVGVVLVIGKVQSDYIAGIDDTIKTALYPNILVI
jgi:hypothetical protein